MTARALATGIAGAASLAASYAGADVAVAEPTTPIEPSFPDGAAEVEVQIVLQLVLDAYGAVESAVEPSRAPASASDAFVAAAIRSVKAATFQAMVRDGHAVRARAEY